MKKITILFAMVLCLASCCRSDKAEDRNTQIVTFDYRVYTELPMTKAVDADGITSWITGQLPSTISLKLTDANGVKYNIETGTRKGDASGCHSQLQDISQWTAETEQTQLHISLMCCVG